MIKHNLLFTIMFIKEVFIILIYCLNFHFFKYNFLNDYHNNILHFKFLCLIISM